MKRLHEIDGIRGWAALSVFIFHLTWEIFGIRFPEFRLSYLRFFVDGPLAVCIFFVLSGDALSSSYLKSLDENLIHKLIAKRYLRLLGPILIASFLVYLLMVCHLTFHMEAARIVDSMDWLGTFLPFKADFFTTILFGATIVLPGSPSVNSYNPFLWPMAIEMFGSVAVFCFLIIYKKLRNPLGAASLLAIYLGILGSFYSLFFVGIAFSILRTRQHFDRASRSKYSNLISFSILGTIVIAECLLTRNGTIHHLVGGAAPAIKGTDYHFLSKLTQLLGSHPNPVRARLNLLLSPLVIYAIYQNSKLTSWMTTRLSVWLGRISFSLYVTHFSVLISYTSWTIIALSKRNQLGFLGALFVIGSSIAIALVLAEVCSRIEILYLKRLTVVTNRWFY